MRWRIAVCLCTWLASAAMMVWVNVGRHYWLALPLGLLSCPVPFSVTMRLFTGRWPDWVATWNMVARRKGE